MDRLKTAGKEGRRKEEVQEGGAEPEPKGRREASLTHPPRGWPGPRSGTRFILPSLPFLQLLLQLHAEPHPALHHCPAFSAFNTPIAFSCFIYQSAHSALHVSPSHPLPPHHQKVGSIKAGTLSMLFSLSRPSGI